MFLLQVENQGRVNYGAYLMDTAEVREIQFLFFFFSETVEISLLFIIQFNYVVSISLLLNLNKPSFRH